MISVAAIVIVAVVILVAVGEIHTGAGMSRDTMLPNTNRLDTGAIARIRIRSGRKKLAVMKFAMRCLEIEMVGISRVVVHLFHFRIGWEGWKGELHFAAPQVVLLRAVH